MILEFHASLGLLSTVRFISQIVSIADMNGAGNTLDSTKTHSNTIIFATPQLAVPFDTMSYIFLGERVWSVCLCDRPAQSSTSSINLHTSISKTNVSTIWIDLVS
eukprot:Blabericola_migrator_1__7594@NODE_3881_length_1452_cov_8_353069_g2402_i0_p2_GENE_NODE_3881_length_1452_cov_8_353069_g2402_i0NODE_3881_length_1452_cov_8_353069_g2402_i0_p2_ORF_typecomplete_len105_score3_71_NODE_3881_length_1452_cov_8_353069_g2402_i07471061